MGFGYEPDASFPPQVRYSRRLTRLRTDWDSATRTTRKNNFPFTALQWTGPTTRALTACKPRYAYYSFNIVLYLTIVSLSQTHLAQARTKSPFLRDR